MAHRVAGADEVVVERRVDQPGEGIPQRMGADFGRGSEDSGSSERRLDHPPPGSPTEPSFEPPAREEESGGRMVCLGMKRHVEASPAAFDCPSPHPDPALDLTGDRHVPYPQAHQGSEPQPGADAEQDEGPFPVPCRGREEVEEALDFKVCQRTAATHEIIKSSHERFPYPKRRPEAKAPDLARVYA